MILHGKCSTFGGPKDMGVGPQEGLAMFQKGLPPETDPRFKLFLKTQPANTSGLARRLNPDALYCAIRFPNITAWRNYLAAVRIEASANGETIQLWVVDWGPHENTNREIDLSPGAALALGVDTDDEVTIRISRGL